MKIIDFRFRPNTAAVLTGIQNSKMFKGLCETIDFSKMKPQTVPEVVADLDRHNVEWAVITGRDCEMTYGSKSNNDVLGPADCHNELLMPETPATPSGLS